MKNLWLSIIAVTTAARRARDETIDDPDSISDADQHALAVDVVRLEVPRARLKGPDMLSATIAISVAPETIAKVGRLFNGSAHDMLVEARSEWLCGLDRAFSRSERGALLVEVRNRRSLLTLGRTMPKQKGPRLDPARLPSQALDSLIQSHPDADLVDRLRAERLRRTRR